MHVIWGGGYNTCGRALTCENGPCMVDLPTEDEVKET